jgi:hypothetical protein
MKVQVWRGLALGVLWFGIPGYAITIIDQGINAGTYYNVLSPAFNGIGRTDSNGLGCSGFAISATQVLTAAHCIGAGPNPTTFNLPLMGPTAYTPDTVRVHPNFNGNLGTGNDVAVLEFSAGVLPSGMNVYPIYQFNDPLDVLGVNFELFGYGSCGTGAGIGGCPTSDPLHRAANRVDVLLSNGIFLYDFVNYAAGQSTIPGDEQCPATSPLCHALDVVFPNKDNVAAIGARQGMISFGDSGGPSIIEVNGSYYSIGMHSFISCLGFTQQSQSCLMPPDVNGGFPNSSFGEFGGDTYLQFHSVFINGVPEPTTWAVMGGGLIAIGWLRRRRK